MGTPSAPFVPSAVVLSKDGTAIGYSQAGRGPGLVLVHGAMQTASSFDALAAALARSFSVVRYDRRCRGACVAGSQGGPEQLARETDDLVALVEATAAPYVFGLSSGAIVALSAALATKRIERVVLYEPPLATNGVDPGEWSDAFLRALAEERLGRAMACLVRGTADRGVLARVPRPFLAALFGLAVRANGRAPNGPLLRDLLLTVPADIAVQREGSRMLPPFSRLTVPALLMGGDRSHRSLGVALDGLERELPAARRARIRGSGHLAADNDGKPEDVARAIDRFLRAGDEGR